MFVFVLKAYAPIWRARLIISQTLFDENVFGSFDIQSLQRNV